MAEELLVVLWLGVGAAPCRQADRYLPTYL